MPRNALSRAGVLGCLLALAVVACREPAPETPDRATAPRAMPAVAALLSPEHTAAIIAVERIHDHAREQRLWYDILDEGEWSRLVRFLGFEPDDAAAWRRSSAPRTI